MRIVHTETGLGLGGQEIRILDEARGMIERGHKVTLLCPPNTQIFIEAPRFGVKVVGLPIGRKNLRAVLAIKHWLDNNQQDIVNTHSNHDTWLAALALMFSRHKPSLIRTRHVSTQVSRKPSTHWLYTKATKHIVTTGEAIRQNLIAHNGYYPDHLTSIPTGIDPEIYRPANRQAVRQNLGLPLDKPLIGIVATFRDWKGHRYLLNACAQIKDQNWYLVIVGDGLYSSRHDLEQLTTELNLQDRVLFAGHSNIVHTWLQALDIFCLPSYGNEGVPQALLQAMSTELPVISTPVGAIAEIVHNNKTGLMIPPKDSPALAQAITRLLRDPILCRQLGSQARELIKSHYSRDKMLDDMEAVFRNAIQHSQSS